MLPFGKPRETIPASFPILNVLFPLIQLEQRLKRRDLAEVHVT